MEILFVLVGVGLIALGIYSLMQMFICKHFAEPVNAKIVSCVEFPKKTSNQVQTFYEVTYQFHTERELVTKKKKTDSRMTDTYETVPALYWSPLRMFVTKRDYNAGSSIGSIFLIAFGLLWCTIIFFGLMSKGTAEQADIAEQFFMYLISFMFIVVGFMIGLFEPLRRFLYVFRNRGKKLAKLSPLNWQYIVIGILVIILGILFFLVQIMSILDSL